VNVEVTGRSGDGGIDGIGILRVNALVVFKVLFQCKRYRATVGPSAIRDFRGAMQGRADKGIFLTTGTFTVAANEEAGRDGVPPIELVDGDRLVELFEKLELGLVPRTTYDVDPKFFEDFKKT
jgi:restriction system protein